MASYNTFVQLPLRIIYKQRPPPGNYLNMLPLLGHNLVLEIKIREIFYPKDSQLFASSNHNPSVVPVDFVLKRSDHLSNSKPRLIAQSANFFFDPEDKENLKKVQFDMRYFNLDSDTILEVVSKLEAYITLNPRKRRLEVTIIQVELMLDDDSKAMSWLVELGNISVCRNIRVKDLDCKEGEEYRCLICLENMAEHQKDPPEWRWPWDPLFIACTYRLTLTCMPCNHVFHDVCISSWLRRSPRCPVYRFNLNKPLVRIYYSFKQLLGG